MALNPAYSSQSTRKLPFCVGYVKAQGTKVNSIVSGVDGATVEEYILAEGEWDSCLYLSVAPGDRFIQGNLVNGTYGRGLNLENGQLLGGQITYNGRPAYYHFHTGRYATKGLPNSLISLGPDQGTDNWLQYFPSITPALTNSGVASYFVRRILTNPFTGASLPAMAPVGIYKSLVCRHFDSSGEVISYNWTANAAWHLVEATLRFQLKPEQPGLMGLSNAEKACFDWPAICDFAARNVEKNFTSNFAFAADSTLANIQETILRSCRAFKRERGQQIAWTGDDPRASVFTFSQRHMVPGSLKMDKKDLSTAPNIYVPQYRELGVPAVAQVASVVTTGSADGINGDCTFNLVGGEPFTSLDIFSYSGGTNDAQFAGDVQVGYYATQLNGLYTLVPPPTNSFTVFGAKPVAGNATGGYVGTQQSRFASYAPTTVQHRAHQRSVGQTAPGIPTLPRRVKVVYDLGNTTYDQANRIMQYMRNRDLGTDGAGWKAPLRATWSAWMESVDDADNAVMELERNDRVTLDDSVTPEMASDFVITKYTPRPGSRWVDLIAESYNPDQFVEVSDAPGDSYQTLPGSGLDMTEMIPIHTPFWLLTAQPTVGVISGSTLTLVVLDLTIQWTGQPAPTIYTGVSLAGIPLGVYVNIYLNVTGRTTLPTVTYDTAAHPPYPLAPGQVVLFSGTITAASAGGSVGTLAGDQGVMGVYALPVAAGGSPALVTPAAPTLDAAVTADWTAPAS